VSMAPRFLVFDCDGTLVDSQHLIHTAMVRTFEGEGLAAPSRGAVRQVIGLHLDQAIARLLPEAGAAEVGRLTASYKTQFFDLRQDPAMQEPLFDGVEDTLRGLADEGHVLAMATGKSRRGAMAVIERCGFEDIFTVVKTADDGPSKPAPAILLDAMAETGFSPRDTVMIGDTTYDIELGRNAGAHAIGVAWGYHPPEILRRVGAATVSERFSALPGDIARLWRASSEGGM
jgi:phosphoglycolate phosphatase